MKDLIDESSEDLTVYGYETTNLKKFGMTCSKLFVETNAKAKKLGFDKGHYFILNTPLLSEFLELDDNLLISFWQPQPDRKIKTPSPYNRHPITLDEMADSL